MPRKRVPLKIQADLLIRSRRRCCLCVHLNQDFEEKEGQVCHLDGDAQNNQPENLVFLCFEHHHRYDSISAIGKGLTSEEVRYARSGLHHYWEQGSVHLSSRSLIGGLEAETARSKKKSAEDYFPRVRQLPVAGLFFVGISEAWCWLRDNWEALPNLLDIETVKQIVLMFFLLVFGMFPLIVLSRTIREPYGNRYRSDWFGLLFLCCGLAAISGGYVARSKYKQEGEAVESARSLLRDFNREHSEAAKQLEIAWQTTSQSAKTSLVVGLAEIRGKIAQDVSSKLDSSLTLFVTGKVTEFNHQNRAVWLELCLLSIAVGVINLICGVALMVAFFSDF